MDDKDVSTVVNYVHRFFYDEDVRREGIALLFQVVVSEGLSSDTQLWAFVGLVAVLPYMTPDEVSALEDTALAMHADDRYRDYYLDVVLDRIERQRRDGLTWRERLARQAALRQGWSLNVRRRCDV